MNFSFKTAVRSNVGLLVSVAGGTGSGKTYSALRLASGLSGGELFCMIDTESGRALHYADQFSFDHGHLTAPFRPEAYADAIEAAVKGGYRVIIVDSASHEHAGDGGLLDWHEEELDRMAGNDWGKRDRCTMAAWIKPKMAHKKMVSRLLALPPHVHLILCLRAEQKVEVAKDEKTGKTIIVEKKSPVGLHGWIPVCEKTLPYEMTISFLLTADRPGIPLPIKLQEQHRSCVDLAKPLSEDTGKALAAWAAGGTATASAAPSAPTMTPDQEEVIEALIVEVGADSAKFWAHFRAKGLTYEQALAALEKKRPA